MTTTPNAPGSRSLRDRAYETLKRRIIEVDLPPGSRLIERDLAAELDVSRIPLREALRLLSAEGLVVIVPGRGTLVSPFTPGDVEDLFDVRESLEVLATRLAAERADDAGLARLRSCLDAAHRCTSDPLRLTDVNADFHSELVTVSNSKLLTTLMRPLDARLRWLFHLAIELDPVAQCAEHEAIYAAIVDRDVERATNLAREHVIGSRGPTLALAQQWTVQDIDPAKVTHTRRRVPPDRR